MSTTNADFPQFLSGYLTAALWSSTINDSGPDGDSPGPLDGDPFDRHFTPADFTPEALEVFTAHARSFWHRAWLWVDAENAKTPTQAGHDFWLTSNGHGAGFWDGDWPVYGEMLSKLSQCYPEIDLSVVETPDGPRVTC